MGAWGLGIFQSDAERHCVQDIDEDARILAGKEDLSLWQTEKPAEVVKKMNDGLFTILLKDYIKLNWGYGVFYLGALAMRMGANITDDQRVQLMIATQHIEQHAQTRDDMIKALRGYQNGHPWNFNTLSLGETLDAPKKRGQGPGINQIEDWMQGLDMDMDKPSKEKIGTVELFLATTEPTRRNPDGGRYVGRRHPGQRGNSEEEIKKGTNDWPNDGVAN